MDRTTIIIGGGTAGLTAGCYAQMNGYSTMIVEMEDTPGGLCTSWRRKGYLFDGSVAGLAGSAQGSPLYQLWEEIGVAKYCPLHYGENFGHIRLPDGRTITVYANIDRLEAHFLECFPDEARVIREFTGALRAVLDLDIPFSDARGWEAVKEGFQTFASSLAHLLADGSQMLADRIISAADGRFTQSLLPGVSEPDLARSFQPEDLSDQPVQVNLGVAADFSAIDGPMTYILNGSFQAAGCEHSRIKVHNKYYDPDAAPEGKSAITVFLDSTYGWWKNIAGDALRYQEEKKRCADSVIAAIDRFHPGFAEQVEVIDVSTPLTRERNTGNWMGAMQARKPKANMIKALMQGSPRYAVKGIEGLYVTASGRRPGAESLQLRSLAGRLFKRYVKRMGSHSKHRNRFKPSGQTRFSTCHCCGETEAEFKKRLLGQLTPHR